MRIKAMCLLVAIGLLASFYVTLLACTEEKDDEEEDKYESVAIEVVRDQLYNFSIGERIGVVKFEKKRGPTGSLVSAACFIETLSRFPDQKVDVILELLNQDAAREVWEPVQWVQDTNEQAFEFIVPVVETIPAILNFRLKVFHYVYNDQQEQTLDDDTATDDDLIDDDLIDDDLVDDDAGDDDLVDDDLADDDLTDDDTAPEEPDKTFEAEAVYLFVVDKGQPGTGD